MNALIGKSERRVDGRDKVTGRAQYAGDFHLPGQLHGVIVNATIGLGRIRSIDASAVETMPGVVAVISHLNAPRLAYKPHKTFIDPAVGERLHVLQDDRIHFYGQPVAVVVARSLDQAERAARALNIRYDRRQPKVDLRDPSLPVVLPEAMGEEADKSRGDLEQAVPGAVTVDERYEIARENHTPIELHATLAAWTGDRLTLWSKSQFVVNEQAEIAAIFGIDPANVQVISPYVGGAFGTTLRTWPHVTLAALAARMTGQPVKLTLSRKQTFYTTGHRPFTTQRVRLGATPDGRLTHVEHEGTGETSRYEQFAEALVSATSYLYSCPNLRVRYRLQPCDTSTPTYMRGPGEASGIFAIECAMDELAYKLEMDPVELRRLNEPKLDEGSGLPFSSRSLLQCHDVGARSFGWARRSPVPGSMKDGRLLVGWGMASGTYPVWFAPASARARITPAGEFEVEAAASDMGPGTYTSITQVAAEALGVPMSAVKFRLGRSDFPPTPPHGGSMTMASVGSGVRAACQALRAELLALAASSAASPFAGASPGDLHWDAGALMRRGASERLGYARLAALGPPGLMATATGGRSEEAGKYSMHAFGAVFVEVAIDPDVYTMHVRRMVGAYGAGRIVNPRLATSQCIGGMVGGIGMAVMESTVLDKRDGRPVNAHMADYLVPVNLDIGDIQVHFIDEEDPYVNPLGVKGLGEISLVGVAPAIANAIYHATGKRVRHLPIRIENLLHGA
ncbi:xanthine dehydrogenase family protein molybdopterin-binding subunit [Luteimonas sp. R10]|uniref:xanthine dehydrogenase family protein molybdopterin-binding subunit n=1 Tax=Luteimonas sp. R10 TaxID=3108176 RepID=UPI00308FBB58|nr:xanthine dehydrogenase family protein molybdopterin-binding subunit [Luteimonas sp. R10]